jgi:hypothetical protein
MIAIRNRVLLYTGLTIISAKWLLERDGELIVTLPEQIHVAPAAIEAGFATAGITLLSARPVSVAYLPRERSGRSGQPYSRSHKRAARRRPPVSTAGSERSTSMGPRGRPSPAPARPERSRPCITAVAAAARATDGR